MDKYGDERLTKMLRLIEKMRNILNYIGMKCFTKYLVLLLSLVLIFPSCDEDALLKETRKKRVESDIKTRAFGVSITSIEGPKELVVGQTYTYKLKLSQAIADYTEFMVVSISQKLMIKYQSLWIDSPMLSVAPGKNEISFEVLAIGAKNDVSISIYSQKGDIFSTQIDDITITNPQFSIEGPTDVTPDTEFVLSAYYKNGNSRDRELRTSYSGSKFILVSGPNFNASSSKYEIRYKARSIIASNQNFTFEIVGTYKGRYNADYNYSITKAEHTVNVLSAFAFNASVTADVICPGTEIVCEMPNYKLVSNAVVNWSANDGFILKSGQNTGRAVFVVSNTYNGYSHISATINYNGKNYSETSKEYWIGKPIFHLSYPETIKYREYHSSMWLTKEGPGNITYRLLSGNAEIEFIGSQIEVTSNAPHNVSEIISLAVDMTNECGTTTRIVKIPVAKITPVIPDAFCIRFPECDGTVFKFELRYEATKIYSYYALYTMIYYIGTYDNSLFGDFQWQQQADGSYFPPVFPLEYANSCYHYNGWDSGGYARVYAGGVKYHTAFFNLAPGKTVFDIEYIVVYYIDGYGNRLHYSMHDFVDYLDLLIVR